jgi:biopolymer transport protein ExbD
MAMNLSSNSATDDSEVIVDINTTPLIDVMLVLLIMLIITIPVQTHAVKLDLPAGNPPRPLVAPQVVTVDIDFDGKMFWNDEAIPDRSTLDSDLASAAAQAVQPELHIRPNKLAPYKFVAAVLASAQRLGIAKIGVVGNEQLVE